MQAFEMLAAAAAAAAVGTAVAAAAAATAAAAACRRRSRLLPSFSRCIHRGGAYAVRVGDCCTLLAPLLTPILSLHVILFAEVERMLGEVEAEKQRRQGGQAAQQQQQP